MQIGSSYSPFKIKSFQALSIAFSLKIKFYSMQDFSWSGLCWFRRSAFSPTTLLSSHHSCLGLLKSCASYFKPLNLQTCYSLCQVFPSHFSLLTSFNLSKRTGRRQERSFWNASNVLFLDLSVCHIFTKVLKLSLMIHALFSMYIILSLMLFI